MLVNPYESAPTALGAVPPDRQPMPLGFHLQTALAMIAEDRQFSPEEQREVTAFLQGLKMIGQARAANGATLMGAQMESPTGFQAGEPEDYMSHAGSPLPGYEE